MAEKSVVWTNTATRQRREILKYWTARNKSTAYAKSLILLIKERIKLIKSNPLAGKPTNYPNVREAAMGNFSIYYRVDNTRITITAFWDNRKDPDELFEFLKIY